MVRFMVFNATSNKTYVIQRRSALFVMICIACICNYKSNYHTIMIDDLRTEKHDYLECVTDYISVVQSGKNLPSSDGYIVPNPEYLDLLEKSSDIPTETLYLNE